MRRLAVVVAVLALLFSGANKSYGQNFFFDPTREDQIESILKFFGSVAGGAMAHSAEVHGLGHFDLDLHAVVVIVPEEFKDLPQFGEVDLVPIPMLQLGLGLPGNVEILARAFHYPLGDDPTKTTIPGYIESAIDSRGGFTLLGAAIKYGVLQMFGLPKIMLVGAYHVFLVPPQFDFGDISNITGQAYISHSLGFLTPYAAVSVDVSRFKITVPDLENTFTTTLVTGTLGLQIKPLPLLHISADYNFSEFPNVGVSVGLSF